MVYHSEALHGEQGWGSGESACLPPKCPRFYSRTRCHMWAEFVGSLLCSERFFSGNSGFLLSSKTNIWFDLIYLIYSLPNKYSTRARLEWFETQIKLLLLLLLLLLWWWWWWWWLVFNNYTPKWRWIVMVIYRAAKQRGKYPSLSPTLRWIIVLVYTTQAE